jgi:predicted alpha/beta-hydrolase family hydrolase
MTAPHTEIRKIKFFADGFELKGTLHMPAGGRPPVVIGCHGLYSSQESPKQIALAAACTAMGIAYFRFDHRGCRSQPGGISTGNVSSRSQPGLDNGS